MLPQAIARNLMLPIIFPWLHKIAPKAQRSDTAARFISDTGQGIASQRPTIRSPGQAGSTTGTLLRVIEYPARLVQLNQPRPAGLNRTETE